MAPNENDIPVIAVQNMGNFTVITKSTPTIIIIINVKSNRYNWTADVVISRVGSENVSERNRNGH